jgi:hypothetical protein
LDNQRPEVIRGKSLHAMTTEQLEELLRLEQDADRAPDVDLIEEILAVLDSRTEVPSSDVDAAWEDFKENHISGEPLYDIPDDACPTPKVARKKRHFRLLITAAVLIVLILGVSVTASATGFNLWNVIAQWTSETLGLQFGKSEETNYDYNPELYDLQRAIRQKESNLKVVPYYLPDGYTQAELHVEEDAIIAKYDNDSEASSIFFQYRKIIHSELGSTFQRDDGSSEEYLSGGITHYISTNMGQHLVAWANAGWECSIMGVSSKQELLRMIDSIYTEE